MTTSTTDDASHRHGRRTAHLEELRVDGLRAFGVPEHLVPEDIHPDAELAHELTREWARSCGLIEGDAQLRAYDEVAYTELFARGCPTAPLDRLVLFARWFTLLFVLDDAQDTAVFEHRDAQFTQVQDDLVALLRGERGAAGGAGLLPAVAELAERTRPLVSRAWWERFVMHFEHTFSAQRVENLRRRDATPSTLEEFKVVRREASTTDVCFDLIEACEDAEVPNAFRYSYACRHLADGLSDFTTMTNDVFGVDRDTDNGDPNNVVTVIQHAHGLDRDDAVAHATADVAALVAELPQRLAEAQAVAARVSGSDSADAVDRACRGWWGFSLNVPRFYLAAGSRLEHMNAFPDGVAPTFTADLLPRP